MQNPTKRDAILPVSVMLCMHSLIALCVFVIPVMAPEIDMDAQEISLFVAVLYLSSTIFTPFSGPFTGRFGPMRMMQACVLASSIGVALCCLGDVVFMFGGAACIGLSLGLASVTSSIDLDRSSFSAPANDGVTYMLNTDYIEFPMLEAPNVSEFKERVGDQDVVTAIFAMQGNRITSF